MISIPKEIYEAMIAHAKSGYPNEACGILAGDKKDEASRFYPMRNLDEASVSYFMDPKEQLEAFKKMRASGIEMRGIFHSHVAGEAAPSQKDVRLAFYPEASYLIVSLSDMEKPVLRSFHIVDEKVEEEKIKIV
jgi:proteasome lid subunit RPN8/RPN11